MIKQIPNIITLLNLFSGTVAITMAFQENYKAVVVWVLIAALFDFFDGFAARLLKAYSDIGKDLDSLADVISFGVAPASALFMILSNNIALPEMLEPIKRFIPYLAFIIPMSSAYRLAKFNNDNRQTESFLGLPTPANGLFWISYCFGIQQLDTTSNIIFYITVFLILVMSVLMVTDIPMFSLKIKNMSIKESARQLLIVILFIIFILLWGIIGIAYTIIAYILISLFTVRYKGQSVK